jgi:APA family basic amino acid/polyamine antiporter
LQKVTLLNSGLTIAIIAGYTCDVSNADGAKQSFYSMSVDGLLPKFFSDLHATNRTPYKTNLLLWYSFIFAGFVPVSDLGHMVSIGTLFAFSLVCIGVIVMRKLIQMQKEVSECLLFLYSIVGVIICLILMAGLPIESWERLAI